MKKIIDNLSYHSSHELSNSKISLLHEGVRNFLMPPQYETDSMNFGQLVHDCVLQPEVFNKTYMPLPDDHDGRTSKESKNLRTKEINNASDACLVVDYFNAKLGTKLQQVESNYKHINARLKEGFTTDQMKTLIDHVSLEWVSDPFWCKYVQLSTMFGGKFDSYLQKIDSGPIRTPEMIETEFRMFL